MLGLASIGYTLRKCLPLSEVWGWADALVEPLEFDVAPSWLVWDDTDAEPEASERPGTVAWSHDNWSAVNGAVVGAVPG